MSEPPAADMLDGRYLFLSASYPAADRDPRYSDNTDVREISNAVLALINAVFSTGGRLVFGGHPTITPLALQQAALFFDPATGHQADSAADDPRVRVYQSNYFDKVIPAAAKQIAASPFGAMIATSYPPGGDEKAERANALRTMRTRMIEDNAPLAAVFIGGMEGIEDEYALCAKLRPQTPRYLVGAPGGAARLLLQEYPPTPADSPASLAALLRESRLYPYLMSELVHDIARFTTID
jgi:hypothetical protein